MSRPSLTSGRYAAVTSTLALVVALGGTSYAATRITGADIANGTVTTADVKDHSLRRTDLAKATVRGLTSHATSVHREQTAPLQGNVPVTVMKIPVTPGSYLVVSKVVSEPTSATSNAACELVLPSGRFDFTEGDPASVTDLTSIVNQIAFTTRSRGTVTLSCFGDGVVLVNSSMTAVQVGTLTSLKPPATP